MRTKKKAAAALSAAALLSGLLTLAGATAAHAADGCDNNHATTVRTAFGGKGQGIELRANGSGNSTCAWGRIVGGAPGMHVWVDRSSDGGRTWEPQLGWTEISSGGSVWTEAWRDSDGRLMRACGDSGYDTAITCTSWY